MTVLVTGAAGFIGFHLSHKLLTEGDDVIGVDNLNDYYDVGLKQARLDQLQAFDRFSFRQVDISDRDAIFALRDEFPNVTHIVHLAAQAGVRYSLINPYQYVHLDPGELVRDGRQPAAPRRGRAGAGQTLVRVGRRDSAGIVGPRGRFSSNQGSEMSALGQKRTFSERSNYVCL